MNGPYPVPVTRQQGQCFAFALPQGYQVAEDGQFAVTLVRQDRCAITVMMGNAGVPLGYPPGRYVYDQLGRIGLQNLQLSNERPGRPAFGFPHAVELDVDYLAGGEHCHGVAKASVLPSYDCATMVMTWAATRAFEWPQHAGWLPAIAEDAQPTSGAAFGASGVMQQNIASSMALREQAQQHRQWSADLWAGVARERDAVQARQQFELREALGGQDRYANPFTGQPVDLPATNAVYWVNRSNGRIVGHPDPSFDPRTAADADWEPLRRARPPG